MKFIKFHEVWNGLESKYNVIKNIKSYIYIFSKEQYFFFLQTNQLRPNKSDNVMKLHNTTQTNFQWSICSLSGARVTSLLLTLLLVISLFTE